MSGLLISAGVIVLGLVSLVFWLKSPWMALLGWVAALSVQYEALPDFRLALSDLFVPALALTLLFGKTAAGDKKLEKRTSLPALIAIFAFVFIVLGTTVTYFRLGTIPRWTWLNKDIGLLDLMVCFFAITRLVDSAEKRNTVVSVFVVSGAALNILALAGGFARYFLGIPNVMMYGSISMRLAGLMANPSAYGGFISCVLLIQLCLLFGESTLLRLPRWAQGANAALLGVGCFMTISRGSLLGLIAGLLALVAFYRKKAAVQLMGLALSTVLIVVLLIYWRGLTADVSDDFWTVVFGETTIQDRMDANRAALDMLFESPTNPIIGSGVGTFLARSEQKLGFELIIHNEFLWLLVETGVVGFVLFSAMMLRALRNCLYVARARSGDSAIAVGILCGIVGILAWIQAGEGLWHRHVWLLLALSEVSYRLHVNARPESAMLRPRHEPRIAIGHGAVEAG
ncbi:MAG: hypothetical protein DMG38_24900 [Acidobacteria bacterium]|nr:MAG: hypothetical protein DMG38_24900 [Acidobacteriota bacterium]